MEFEEIGANNLELGVALHSAIGGLTDLTNFRMKGQGRVFSP